MALTNAERQRRWRNRQSQDLVQVTVDVPQEQLIELLVSRCLLDYDEALDPANVRRAFGEFLNAEISRNAVTCKRRQVGRF
jgi:hypothetical protein